MHTIIRYAGQSELANNLKAIEDIRGWLGRPRFQSLVREFKAQTMAFNQFEMYLSIAGISGYPVKAFYEYIYGVKP